MRIITRYAGVVVVVTAVAVLGGCANLNRQGASQSAQTQALHLTTATPNASINVASGTSPFPQNKQNEPAVAINPLDPNIVAAGANDEVDLQPCNDDPSVGCPFTSGVGVSGIYFSLDGGASWVQPTYLNGGLTAAGCNSADANCAATTGAIHTLPNYAAAGLVSDGDPALAFGPAPSASGFSWDNGVRLYYGNLTSNLGSTRSETAFKGYEAIAVSYTDNVASAANGNADAWSDPVIVSKQNAALFSDKDALWADNNANSPYFGNVYMCNVAFRSQEMSPYSLPNPVIVSRSTDGGATWSNQQISPAANNLTGNGRQGCAVRTDSQGVVYVFYLGASHKKSHPPVNDSAILMARSTNGGLSFRPARVVSTVTECGLYSSTGGDVFFDGIAGARTDSFPSVDIANGAPDNTDASDAIAVTWCDASNGVDNEQALVTISTDGGTHWSTPTNGAASGDRPDFPSIAISPGGSDVYLTYMAFLDPYQYDTTSSRRMQGVVRHATRDGTSLVNWSTPYRDTSGDARASSANSLTAEFLGDYTYTAATSENVVALWTSSAGAVCSAVNAYRTGGDPVSVPNDCGVNSTFGNTDIASYAAPIP